MDHTETVKAIRHSRTLVDAHNAARKIQEYRKWAESGDACPGSGADPVAQINNALMAAHNRISPPAWSGQGMAE